MTNTNQFRIRVVVDNKEFEVSYPLSERTAVVYGSESALDYSVKALKDIVEILKV